MEAPKIPSMFGIRTKKPNQFYFEPRYYDEKKEKMKKRYEQIGKEVELEKSQEYRKEEFKSTLKESWGSGYARNKVGNQSGRRVIIYVIILLAIAYYILF